MAEVQAEALVAEEVRLQEEKEILRRDAKADSEATVHRLQEMDLAEDQVLHVAKVDFHQTVRREEQIHQERKALLKERQDVRKALVTSQNVQEKAKRKSFS